jgi:ATP-dependent DNA helicase RecG
MLQKESIIARDYRNRRIGDFLKELQLTEGRSTRFPKIYKAMQQNGSPHPTFETDSNRSYFLAKLPIHSILKEGAQEEVQLEIYDFNRIERAILAYLVKGPSSRSDIIDNVGSGS